MLGELKVSVNQQEKNLLSSANIFIHVEKSFQIRFLFPHHDQTPSSLKMHPGL